jgi:hypothetical protein
MPHVGRRNLTLKAARIAPDRDKIVEVQGGDQMKR